MTAKVSDAWIFVSHSTRDLVAVRRIRNALEERNANPILFFLKQEVPNDLLRRFITGEIDARNFFLLCDSDNARHSDYVQFEVEHVGKKEYIRRVTVDLARPWEEQIEKIERLLSNATAFISYAHADRNRVQPFIDFLVSEDFAIFDPVKDNRLDELWIDPIRRAIDEAGRGGNFIQFLTQRSLQSRWVAAEFLTFLQLSGGVASGRAPVLVSLEPIQSLALPPQLAIHQIIDTTAMSFEQACDELKQALL